MMRNRQGGFTIVELLSAMLVFSVISAGFYSVMFSVVKGSNDARSVSDVSEEARMGFNRMVRDTREGAEILAASPTSFTVSVDYGNDNLGPQEITFSKSGDRLLLNGEELIEGVDCLRPTPSSACSQDPFVYSSNRLEYDWNRNGVTSWQELDASASSTHGVVGVGNNDGQLNMELVLITDVTFGFRISSGGASGRLIAQAQLRNGR